MLHFPVNDITRAIYGTVIAILAVAYGIASVLTFVFVQVNTYRNKRNLPLKR